MKLILSDLRHPSTSVETLIQYSYTMDGATPIDRANMFKELVESGDCARR